MAAKPIPADTIERIIADWRTGQYSQQMLADKHKVSKGLVNKHTKGVEQDVMPKNRNCSYTPEPRNVYIITTEQFKQEHIYKIGLSNDTQRRIADMQTGCPFPLFAYRNYKVDNPVAIESMLHLFFHKKRMAGEWFYLTDSDLDFIDSALNNGAIE